MRIILVRPPFYSLFGVTNPKMKTYPLNLLYLATYARDMGGHEVRIVDGETLTLSGADEVFDPGADPGLAVSRGIPRMLGLLRDPDHSVWEEMEDRILEQNPDLVGITCNSGNMDTVRVLTARLKNRGIPTILGGSHPTALPEQSILYTEADMVAMGEGERTLVEVADALQLGRPLSGIDSLAYRGNGEIRVNPRGKLIDPIDSLPIPDRSFVDRAEYFGDAIMTGRGCPFDCVYCASRNIWGKRVRLRSVQSIVEELEILKASNEPPGRQAGKPVLQSPSYLSRPSRVVKVLDDTFTVNRRRTSELLDAIMAAGLAGGNAGSSGETTDGSLGGTAGLSSSVFPGFEFTGGVRADTLDQELVQKMARCNFKRVTLGVESGSPRILKMIRKGETNEDVTRAVALLRDAGIKSHAFFMIGLPGETQEDIELSKRLILDIRPDHVEINMVTPYPGTDLFPQLIEQDPLTIDRWYRWFHQGLATHSDRLGFDLDKAYEDFAAFARGYNEG